MFVKPEEKAPGEIHERSDREICEEGLKLSILIRLGCSMHPQGKEWNYFEGRTCAMGAAWKASGDPSWPRFCAQWCVALRDARVDLVEIFKRNDRGETREQIADWLESKGL